MNSNLFGEYFRTCREALKQTQSEFSFANGFQVSNVNMVESGKYIPHAQGALERYAAALKLEKGSIQYYKFMDLAGVCGGRIPVDLLEHRDLILGFFEGLRSKLVGTGADNKSSNDSPHTCREEEGAGTGL